MKNKRTYLDKVDLLELGIKPGTTAESTALEYIPYWESDPRYPFWYCEGEEFIKNNIEQVKNYRFRGLAHSCWRDKRYFLKGYNAALRDVINLLKIEGILVVDESDCSPDDESPFNMNY